MKVERPLQAKLDRPRDCVKLFFKTNPVAEYCMRGGVAWPFAYQSGTDMTVRGYAVLIGMDVRTKHMIVFEYAEFCTVDHIIASDGSMKQTGVSQWLNNNWTKYNAINYYWHEIGIVNLRYRRAVKQCIAINPKPKFKEAKWSDEDSAQHIIWQAITEERLTMPPKLLQALQVAQANPDMPNPEQHALLCALASFEQKPWRQREAQPSWWRPDI